MSSKILWFPVAYMVSGSMFIEILKWWVPFKLAYAMGMALCFLIVFYSKMKMQSVVILGGLYCLLHFLDNYFSIYWISDQKQSDLIAVLGSAVLFSIP
jgi:hypothetical protein